MAAFLSSLFRLPMCSTILILNGSGAKFIISIFKSSLFYIMIFSFLLTFLSFIMYCCS